MFTPHSDVARQVPATSDLTAVYFKIANAFSSWLFWIGQEKRLVISKMGEIIDRRKFRAAFRY